VQNNAKTLTTLTILAAGAMVVAALVLPFIYPARSLSDITGADAPAPTSNTTASLEDFTPLYDRRYQSWETPTDSSAPTVRPEDSVANAHGIVYQGSIIEQGHSFGFFDTDAGQAFEKVGQTLSTDQGDATILDIQPDHAVIQFNNQKLTLEREGADSNPFNATPVPQTNSTSTTTKNPAAGRTVIGRSK
jgi:hypothetical protein